MANQDLPTKIKVVSNVSDPPTLSAADLTRIQEESQRLHEVFTARTSSMEMLSVEDLKVRAR